MDVEPLRLEPGEAIGDGLKRLADCIEMVQPFLETEVGKVVGAEFVAQERGELLILLEEGSLEIGAEDMMAMLDLIDNGGELAFHLSEQTYGLNQLRYDLRKLKGHGLIERDGSRYAYRLTPKGVQVALLFPFFHKRLCGPLANSRFHHEPDPKHRPQSQLETAYHRADKAIHQIVELLAAA